MTTTRDLRDAVPGATGTVSIVDHAEQHRYELWVDGDVRGLIVYSDAGRVRALVHTEIDHRLQGNGLAGDLTRRALADIEHDGLTVQPACPYVEWFIERHPEYQHLLAV